ncbi:MAG: hypothetical protein UU63_C0058G0007, partial [Candidatus Uhrbacteria bacterium GW2011_GWF2_41_430]
MRPQSLPDRLKAGHQVLVLGIGVRIPVREPQSRDLTVEVGFLLFVV